MLEKNLAINKELKSEDVLVLPMDMVDYSSHQSAFQKILDHFGRVS